MYAIKNHGYEGNVVKGFDQTEKVNEILDIDKRYRPELMIPFGKSDEHGTASYRLPQEKIIEIR